SVLFGLSSFVLCLTAEASRSKEAKPCMVPPFQASPSNSPAMAITHAELSSLQTHWRTDIGNRIALFLVLLSVLFGLSSFVLCLTAEASRSKSVYTGSGRTPLACGVCSFLLLAVAMFVEHAYMLVAVTCPSHPAPAAWPLPDDPRTLSFTGRWLAASSYSRPGENPFVCSIAELLLIGIGVESGHVSQLRQPKPDCHVIRPVLFAAAGIFGLISVLLGVGQYLTALQTQRLHLLEENMLRDHPHQFPPPEAP
ncbi:hypothetical protein B296_00032720, partial [Ensete ventricosum]